MPRPAARCGCSSRTAGHRQREQRRDFIYVDDAVAVVRWLMQTPQVFRHLQRRHRQGAKLSRPDLGAVRALGLEPKIEYVDMPENIRGQYQYFTEAKVDHLLGAGYNAGFTSLEDGVQTLRDRVPRHRRPLSLSQGHHVRLRKTPC